MSEQFAGLSGTCLAAGRITGFNDPASITTNSHFGFSNATRLGTGHYSVKLATACDPAQRAVTATPGAAAAADLTVNEDLTLADDNTVAFFLLFAGQPIDGTVSFDVTRTDR